MPLDGPSEHAGDLHEALELLARQLRSMPGVALAGVPFGVLAEQLKADPDAVRVCMDVCDLRPKHAASRRAGPTGTDLSRLLTRRMDDWLEDETARGRARRLGTLADEIKKQDLKLTSVSDNLISQWRGGRVPTPRQMAALVEVLDVDQATTLRLIHLAARETKGADRWLLIMHILTTRGPRGQFGHAPSAHEQYERWLHLVEQMRTWG